MGPCVTAAGVGSALTVQIQQGVEDFALDLPGALRHAGHPQPLVDGLGRHDVVASVGVNPPLGQRRADDGANPAQESQDEAQQLQPRVGHGSLGLPHRLGGGRCTSGSLQVRPGTPGGGGAARRKLLRGALLPASPLEKLWVRVRVRVRVGAGVGRRETAATSGPGLRRRAAGRRDLKQPRPGRPGRRAAPPGGFGAAYGEARGSVGARDRPRGLGRKVPPPKGGTGRGRAGAQSVPQLASSLFSPSSFPLLAFPGFPFIQSTFIQK